MRIFKIQPLDAHQSSPAHLIFYLFLNHKSSSPVCIVHPNFPSIKHLTVHLLQCCVSLVLRRKLDKTKSFRLAACGMAYNLRRNNITTLRENILESCLVSVVGKTADEQVGAAACGGRRGGPIPQWKRKPASSSSPPAEL